MDLIMHDKSMDDLKVAKKYLAKANNAKSAGFDFTLSLKSFQNLMRAKKCGYTGIHLTEGGGPQPLFSDISIDRIDNSKGYVKGNVIAVAHGVNQFKGNLENPNSVFGFKECERMLKTIKRKTK